MIAQSHSLPAKPRATRGQTAAGHATQRQTRSILPVRRRIPGVALLKPLINASARSPRVFVARPPAKHGPMNAGPAATSLLGAASCQEMVQSQVATVTSRMRMPANWRSRMLPGPIPATYAQTRTNPMVAEKRHWS